LRLLFCRGLLAEFLRTGMTYPLLEIDTERAYINALTVRRLCHKNGIEPTAVIKGYNAIDCITAAIIRAGFKTLASSRLEHLKHVKEKYGAETMALRIPMLCEIPELVSCADISLNSEYSTLEKLNDEAGRPGKIHKVILMRDLGDLREGIWDREEFYKTALRIENELPSLRLYGIGVNLTCYGSVTPTRENLGELADDCREIEQLTGRKLEVVSGGGTTSFMLMIKEGLPEGINNLRIGEAILVPRVLSDYWKCEVPELSNRVFLLRAQIIECGEKPTMPKGVLGINAFGIKQY
jgi:predicted amino acid racemase